jgi:hypothetical protein
MVIRMVSGVEKMAALAIITAWTIFGGRAEKTACNLASEH